MVSDPIDGGGDMEWEKFANGASARRRRVVNCNETAPMQPDYSNSWANSSQGFAVKGPDIDKIRDETHR